MSRAGNAETSSNTKRRSKVIEAVSFLHLHEPGTVCQLQGSNVVAIASRWKAMYKHFQLLSPANGRQGEGIFNVVASADGQLTIS
jgi:hypothetical protein